MRILRYTSFLLILLTVAAVPDAMPQDAGAILEGMDKIIFSPKDREGKITIILTDKAGKEKIREATMLQKGPAKKLYRYTKPESQAGIATLSLPNDVMWLYMPAFAKPKKISMLAESQTFNNTDFLLEDMATIPYADRYIPELLQSDEDAYLLNLVPKSEKSNYSKIVVKVSKLYGYAVTMDYYDRKGKKFKEQTYRYEKIGQYWNASEIVMKDLEKNHSTKILLSDVKFDQGLPDELFLVERMKLPEAKKQN
ncbi:MAG: outer membrane lipoprotein-sorting protein [Bacteroidales bacterium]|nr:outer membrane lipoprotein-sorting protein [Bacteroidales bacterium]